MGHAVSLQNVTKGNIGVGCKGWRGRLQSQSILYTSVTCEIPQALELWMLQMRVM